MTYNIGKYFEDENVTKLILKPPEKYIKSPRYISIHRKRTREELARAKSSHKSLGLPRVSLRPPSDYLKKGSRSASSPPRVERESCKARCQPRRSPDWRAAPRTANASMMKDFCKCNVENAKRLKPKRPEAIIVDTRRGDRQKLATSGLQPMYIYKKNFGEMPEMLKRRKSAPCTRGKPEQEQAEYDVYVQSRIAMKKNHCKYITEDERTKLIEKMKVKFSELMKQFQCLPFLIDTTSKIKRKALLEEKLRQLEKDIQLIENHQYIYIYDEKQDKQSF